MSGIDGFVIAPKPTAHFGAGSIERLPAIIDAIGAEAVVVVTDRAIVVLDVKRWTRRPTRPSAG